MTPNSRDRARSLELIIRAAAAEERLYGRRLARMAEEQRRTRADIANGDGRREPLPQPEAGNSER
jgi:hypothetical protein